MKRSLLIFFIFTGFLGQMEMTGQSKFSAFNGNIHFFSKAPLEDIEAESNKLIGAFDLESGDLLFRISVKTFEFDKKLMQKHFNTQYLESDQFPEAQFIGKMLILPPEEFEISQIPVRGDLTIHGVTQLLECTVTLSKVESEIIGTTEFKVSLEDFDIKIPKMVVKNIAEVIDIRVVAKFNEVNTQ